MERKQRPIGMFDSGVGGISVLREAVRQLPHEDFVFYGDTAHAPYGTKTRAEVLGLARNVVEILLQYEVKAIVIACNTATSAAAAALRGEYDFPIIGMEPALKPASRFHQDGIVLSLATPGTIGGEKYADLLKRYGEGVISLPCPGLMEFVERGEMDSPALHAYFDNLLSPYRDRKIEAAVLGCTHYVFLKDALARYLPGVPLLDGNEGTVRRLHDLLEARDELTDKAEDGHVTLLSSGDADAVALMNRLLYTETKKVP